MSDQAFGGTHVITAPANAPVAFEALLEDAGLAPATLATKAELEQAVANLQAQIDALAP